MDDKTDNVIGDKMGDSNSDLNEKTAQVKRLTSENTALRSELRQRQRVAQNEQARDARLLAESMQHIETLQPGAHLRHFLLQRPAPDQPAPPALTAWRLKPGRRESLTESALIHCLEATI